MERTHWQRISGRLWTAVAIAITFGLLSVGRAAAENEKLVLRMVDSYGQMPTGLKSAAEQVTALFQEIGVSASWSSTDDVTVPTRDQAELVVLLRRARPQDIGLAPDVLGVVMSKRTPQRFLFIFLPNIARTMGVRLGGMLGAEDERLMARALSRVIVHEAFHAIAPELEHAEHGVTSASLTRDLLAKRGAEIAPDSAAHFRAELGRLCAHAED